MANIRFYLSNKEFIDKRWDLIPRLGEKVSMMGNMYGVKDVIWSLITPNPFDDSHIANVIMEKLQSTEPEVKQGENKSIH